MAGHRRISRDVVFLFAARTVRLFAYGAISVVLVLYLAARGLEETRIGLLLSVTLLGDTLLSLYLTTRADALGRRRVLIIGASLLTLAGVVFALTGNFALLLVAAIVGVISPSGNEVGPFIAVEQTALTQTATANRRITLFAWYNLAGSFATAAGSLVAGYVVTAVRRTGSTELYAYQFVIVGYAVIGVFLALLFTQLSKHVEAVAPAVPAHWLRLQHSRSIVSRLSALFALDSFAGGFIVQALLAYWFHVRFGLQPDALGRFFFVANLLAGFSSLAAAAIARRFGLLKTMVYTHLPSNVLLLLVPLMPNVQSAIAILLARFCISQMDVPTRQAYVMAVVPAHERSAAAGITGVARTIGAAMSPIVAAPLFGHSSLAALPFLVAGVLKIVYDLALLHSFHKTLLHPD